MKRSLFIMTHLGSNWELLNRALSQSPSYQCFNTGVTYRHHEDVMSLTELPHQVGNSASIWCDVIFHNKDFAMKTMCEHYKYIFWTNPRAETLDRLRQFEPDHAESYYDFRMVGLKQYYARCPHSLWNPDLKSDSLFSSIFG
jgi:hypothetical protein